MYLGEKPLVIFDGECHLCSRAVQFILKHERLPEILFIAYQNYYPTSSENSIPESIEFIENQHHYRKSEAVFHIAKYLKQPYRSIRVFRYFPRIINDLMYSLVARNRYSVFGKRDVCWFPEERYAHRFIIRKNGSPEYKI